MKRICKSTLGESTSPNFIQKNNWKTWERDVGLSENILIYKYSPNYNSTGISDEPSLSPFKKFKLIHRGKRHRLEPEDIAPDDYQ